MSDERQGALDPASDDAGRTLLLRYRRAHRYGDTVEMRLIKDAGQGNRYFLDHIRDVDRKLIVEDAALHQVFADERQDALFLEVNGYGGGPSFRSALQRYVRNLSPLESEQRCLNAGRFQEAKGYAKNRRHYRRTALIEMFVTLRCFWKGHVPQVRQESEHVLRASCKRCGMSFAFVRNRRPFDANTQFKGQI